MAKKQISTGVGFLIIAVLFGTIAAIFVLSDRWAKSPQGQRAIKLAEEKRNAESTRREAAEKTANEKRDQELRDTELLVQSLRGTGAITEVNPEGGYARASPEIWDRSTLEAKQKTVRTIAHLFQLQQTSMSAQIRSSRNDDVFAESDASGKITIRR